MVTFKINKTQNPTAKSQQKRIQNNSNNRAIIKLNDNKHAPNNTNMEFVVGIYTNKAKDNRIFMVVENTVTAGS